MSGYCVDGEPAKLSLKEHYLVVSKNTDLKETLDLAASLSPERALRLAQIQLNQFQLYKSSGDAQVNAACCLEAILEIEQARLHSVNAVQRCAQEVSDEAVNAALSKASAGFFQTNAYSVDFERGLGSNDSARDYMAGF